MTRDNTHGESVTSEWIGPTRSRPVVLLVSSDIAGVVEPARAALETAGCEVRHSADCERALEVAQRELPDLVLVDLTCPEADARALSRGLEADSRTVAIPILMITARKDEADLTLGLALGADDYVTKPLDAEKLIRRMRRVLAAAGRGGVGTMPSQTVQEVLRVGPLRINLGRREVTVGGKVADLTLPQFKLLVALVQARGQALTCQELLDRSMGTDVFITDRAIDVQITSLRRALGPAGRMIRTAGAGGAYRLAASSPQEA